MVSLASLWLPILLSAVLVFAVSSVIHMVLGYHRTDYGAVPNEAAVMDALRHVPPGEYNMPHPPSAAAFKDPAFVERMKQGPVAILTVWPRGVPAMGKNMALWFAYCVVVGVFAAYVSSRALGGGADYLDVFRFSGTVGFAGYGLALAQNSIWLGRSWTTTAKSLMDALIYALLTAGVFGWLWPNG